MQLPNPTPAQPELTDQQKYELLSDWIPKQEASKAARDAEVGTRKQIAALMFPNAHEGTNVLPYLATHEIVLNVRTNRSVDEAAYDNVKAADIKKHKLNMDELFPLRPTLNLKAYREIMESGTDAQKVFVESLLSVSDEPSLPSLSIRERNPSPPLPARVPPVELLPLVTESTQAKPGCYFINTDESVWQLNTSFAWEKVDDADIVNRIHAQAKGNDSAPAATAPKRRGRKPGSTNKKK